MPLSTFDAHLQTIELLAAANTQILEVKRSFLESHTLALFVKEAQVDALQEQVNEDLLSTDNVKRNNAAVKNKYLALARLFGYEIAHPHKIDGSLHMVLNPEDVRTVIEAGWGERHPLSRESWWWVDYFTKKTWGQTRPRVPENLCFIYAPRNGKDVDFETLSRMLEAAAWWATGEDVNSAGRAIEPSDIQE